MADTLRRRKLAKKVLESNGDIAISKAMREVGYGEGYAKNPHLVTNTKSWQQLMEEYLPDNLVLSKHQDLLNKTDQHGELDTNAVKAGVDMAYKLKKRYENPDQIIIVKKFEEMTDEELQEQIDARLGQTRKD